MRKNNTAIIFGSLFFSCSVMAANGTLAPTVVPMVNGGQASIAISNTSPNLFTVPGDRITALWATLALMYVSLAVISGKYPVLPGKMKCIRGVSGITKGGCLPVRVK
ncbi:TPA: hypothetical protein JK849_004546 [Escherichia coli]|nr:hypothetical protein [Escherichia coli]